jgi:hypothetical protein
MLKKFARLDAELRPRHTLGMESVFGLADVALLAVGPGLVLSPAREVSHAGELLHVGSPEPAFHFGGAAPS